MHIERLTRMVNDIAHFFEVEPDHAAGVHGIADHLLRFWDGRMLDQITAHLQAGGEGLEPMAREAVGQVAEKRKAAA
jgi:formate dehydrogenase subunit delta